MTLPHAYAMLLLRWLITPSEYYAIYGKEIKMDKQNGTWERIENPYGELEGFICECGHQSDSASNYCSNCGRKMLGGDKKK